jgi:tetratricopeptide (TPR) repeat protein
LQLAFDAAIMLSPAYSEIKRLRSTGNGSEAVALLEAHRPSNDYDAFEATICLFVCGEMDSCLRVARTYPWKAAWASKMALALGSLVERGDVGAALSVAREAMSDPGAGNDAAAIYLIVLQANGLIEEADAFVNRRYRTPPAGEALLLTIMAEIAVAMRNWRRSYQLASEVMSLDADDYRALMTLSITHFALGNFHEALGNALRANRVRKGSQPAILEIMRCHNRLGDYYSAIGAFSQLDGRDVVLPDIQIELGIAWSGVEKKVEAVASLHAALSSAQRPIRAIRTLLKIHYQHGDAGELDALARDYAEEIRADVDCLYSLSLARLDRGDLKAAAELLNESYALSRKQNIALDQFPWPVPEPRLRHDIEQLELLARRGKLDAAGHGALAVLKRYGDQTQDLNATFAPTGADGDALEQALTGAWHWPALPFAGHALGDNDYGKIEQQYLSGRPAIVVIDNFLSSEALALLRRFSEEATVWKVNYNQERGYTGALLSQGFCPPVLLAIADQLKRAMPGVIGDYPLLQAWGFKYDQRMQGINMHADFAKINVNFWITPDSACADNTTGGMVVYDVPVPSSWTFEEYNTDRAKMQAFLKAHGAKPMRVPYRENRCVLFDSSLIHITDELHFKPGYENRRVNVTLLYGRAHSYG